MKILQCLLAGYLNLIERLCVQGIGHCQRMGRNPVMSLTHGNLNSRNQGIEFFVYLIHVRCKGSGQGIYGVTFYIVFITVVEPLAAFGGNGRICLERFLRYLTESTIGFAQQAEKKAFAAGEVLHEMIYRQVVLCK